MHGPPIQGSPDQCRSSRGRTSRQHGPSASEPGPAPGNVRSPGIAQHHRFRVRTDPAHRRTDRKLRGHRNPPSAEDHSGRRQRVSVPWLAACPGHRSAHSEPPVRYRWLGPARWLYLPLRPGIDTDDIFEAWMDRQRRVGDDDIVYQHEVGSSLIVDAFEYIDPVRPEVVRLQDSLHLLSPLLMRGRPGQSWPYPGSLSCAAHAPPYGGQVSARPLAPG